MHPRSSSSWARVLAGTCALSSRSTSSEAVTGSKHLAAAAHLRRLQRLRPLLQSGLQLRQAQVALPPLLLLLGQLGLQLLGLQPQPLVLLRHRAMGRQG